VSGAECLLALHLLANHPPDGVLPAGDGLPALRAADFIEPDRLDVLAAAAALLLDGDDVGDDDSERSIGR